MQAKAMTHLMSILTAKIDAASKACALTMLAIALEAGQEKTVEKVTLKDFLPLFFEATPWIEICRNLPFSVFEWCNMCW
jgi:hypothetical protein